MYLWLILWSYKKIGLSHEMGLIDTPPLYKTVNVLNHEDLLSLSHFIYSITSLLKFISYLL